VRAPSSRRKPAPDDSHKSPAERKGGTAREAFQQAFELTGGPDALAAWGREKPTEFYRLFARLIPLGDAGPGADPLEVEIVRFSDPDEADADDPAA
jgi:hypothetical protein